MQRNNNGGAAASAGAGQPACASCKHQRKRCDDKCVLAPYFPADKAADFQAVQKVFGVSNVSKMVQGAATEEDRRLLAQSLIWEAQWRTRDPIRGPYAEFLRVSNELIYYRSLAGRNQPPQQSPSGWSNYQNNGNSNIHNNHAKVEPNGINLSSYRLGGNNNGNSSAGAANFPGPPASAMSNYAISIDNGNSVIDPSAYGSVVIANGQSRGFNGNHHQEREAVAAPVQAVPLLPPQRRANGFNHQHQYHNHNGFSGT